MTMWEYRTDFEKCLNPIFTEIAMRAYNGKPTAKGLSEEAKECLERFFQVMQGAVNLTPQDVEEALDWASHIEESFYSSLWQLVERLPQYVDVVSPDKMYADPYWDTGLVHGCNIKAGDCYLYASPRVPAATSCWMALVQEPVAATVLAVDGDCILMLPTGQYTSEGFSDEFKETFGERKDISDEFPSAYSARVYPGFLQLDSNIKMDSTVMDSVLERYDVRAVVKVNLSQQSGYIYTGTEEAAPALQRKIYYEWHENWRVY
jgi:hypothetical protein